MRFVSRRAVAFISVMTAVGVVSVSVGAQEAPDELDDLHSQLASARAEISVIQGQADSVEDQIASIDDQIAAVERALDVSSQLVERTQVDIAILHNRIADTLRRFEQVRAQARNIAVDLYKAGPYVDFGMLLSAKNLAELDSLMRYSSAATKDKIRIMVSLQRLEAELESDKTELVLKLAEAKEARDARIAQRQHLTELRSAQTAKLDDLRERIAAARAEAEALAARSEEIEQQLVTFGSSTASPTGAGDAGFAWPISGAITSGYGERWGGMHDGIDIDCVTGAAIQASKGGTVVSATYDGGYGYHIVIDHGGGFASLYAHNSKLSVNSGQSVSQGEVISACGSTGQSTGDHLHFEIRVNGAPQDPLAYLP